MPLRKKPLRLSLLQRRLIKASLHLTLLGYLFWLFYAGVNDNLGPDPVNTLINETGIWAIHLLLTTLLLSPLAQWLPSPEPLQFRRMIGVYSFVYAFAHLFTYVFFEIQLDMALVASEIVSRPYIVVGMTALLLLLALTATSFKRVQRKMGKRWQKLHNTIYLILPLTLLHFSWSQKTFWQEPVWYWLIGIGVLTPRFKKWINQYKQKQVRKKRTTLA
ncbi:protein-methionine-sulfoxide reductase heme-binding subunit MsrQ [Alteromonas sp. KC3]|uniref:sulfite oxidase heme-binding subunit YedZ n=1 Tax=unclassified Alteromonas TaxID=2614992 RepID=UPI001920F709|nr:MULTISPECIES: protein-methionine-sulfoxide reductase heme-binding subunit MsrQ [unclassified Alteromonas]BCO18908.1 protein-methionine-sulfoxide reductase heme-binding subunit MsrQ [Alteromonas sp. KC3]BCO22865.1 protein-methionine-sulfoxide reductase heme-binding subunit MsrQ [Alteromonas sp. KC14]